MLTCVDRWLATFLFTIVSCCLWVRFDWTHGGEHMWSGHLVTIAEASEALTDADARLFDPDPNSKDVNSARVAGYCPTAVAVLVVILVHREDRPRSWWCANR
jgi:hypothetical protein